MIPDRITSRKQLREWLNTHKARIVRNRFRCVCGWKGTERIEKLNAFGNWDDASVVQYDTALREQLNH